MRKILAMIAKELSHLKRDKRSLMIMFFMPVLELAVLGYASNMDITSLAMVVVDRDHSSSSRALVDDFLATEYFVLAGREQDLDAIDREIDRGRAVMALVIPVDFEKGLLQGRGAQVEAIFDGSESYTANAGIGYASIIVARYSRNVGVNAVLRDPATGVRQPVMDVRTRVWFNPELQSRKFLIPGIVAMLLMLVTILLTSLSIVREKEAGTLEQLYVTPIRPHELIIGKLAPFFLIGFLELTILTLE
ncbi:MAG TPA: ABC transporter permease, partial [Spirochaetia bacterium]|nr:ABC transporter permease [Spirochaetia bacterium]